MASTFTARVEQEGDDLVLQFPPEMIAELDWQPGDTIRWIDNEDGTFTLVRGDDLVLSFPPEMIAELGWQPGDTLRWIDNADGTFTLVRKE